MSMPSSNAGPKPSLFSDRRVTITPTQIKIDKKVYAVRAIQTVYIDRYDDSVLKFVSPVLFLFSIYMQYQYPKQIVSFGFVADLLHSSLHPKPAFDASAFHLPVSALLFLASFGTYAWLQSRSEWLVLNIGGNRTRVMEESLSKRSYMEKLKVQIEKAINIP